MSMNIDQVYTVNPITSNASTDLMYFGRSPYGATDDVAMLYSNFSSQFSPPAGKWVDQTTTPATMTTNTGYTSDDGSTLVVLSLPTSSAIGDWVEVNGKGSGLWKIAQATGQQINISSSSTTSGATGYLSSVNQYDCVRLRCIVANTIWVVVSQQSSGLTVF